MRCCWDAAAPTPLPAQHQEPGAPAKAPLPALPTLGSPLSHSASCSLRATASTKSTPSHPQHPGQRSRLADLIPRETKLASEPQDGHVATPNHCCLPTDASAALHASGGQALGHTPDPGPSTPHTPCRPSLLAEKAQVKSWGRTRHHGARWGVSPGSAGACVKSKWRCARAMQPGLSSHPRHQPFQALWSSS